jgi:hypothetical protein
VEHQTLVVAAALLAVAAAIRSAWSPCSLSMLSMLTPFGESGRGNRYPVAATTFVVAAVVGGVCLGLVPAVLAIGVDAANLGTAQTSAVVAAAALLSLAGDTGLLPTPRVPRQVNESWFAQYRAWVYGIGYGWQLGAGVTTYVMTTAVYLMLVLAALTASATTALMICGGFGAIRGLTILLGVRLVHPEAIRGLHHRFDVSEPASRAIAVVAQVAVLSVGVAGFAPLWLAMGLGAVIVAAVVSARSMASRAASVS